jgi:hypothetical protein
MADRQDLVIDPASLDATNAISSDLPETTKHIVMWNVRGDDAAGRQSAIALVKSSFEDLIGVIPGLLRMEIGVDVSGVDYACDVVLVSEFKDGAALAAYATHPAHLAVRDRLTGVRTGRFQVDYQSARWPPESHTSG